MRLNVVFSGNSVSHAAVPLQRKKDKKPFYPLTDHEVVTTLRELRAKYHRGASRTKWYPRVVTPVTLLRGRQRIAKYAPPNKDFYRRVEFLKVFFRINRLHSLEEGAEALYSSLSEKLAEGSVVEYLKTAKEVYGEAGPLFQRVMKAANKAHALADTSHAVDCASEDLLQSITLLQNKSRYVGIAAALELILKTGLRFCDIRTIGSVQLRFDSEMLKMEVRTAKNRKRRADRVIVRVPTSWFGELTLATQTFLAGGPCAPFEKFTINDILNGLHTVHASATTYSFRRCMFHKALVECDFDFEKCCQLYTLHKQTRTLRAYYDSLDI